MIKDSGIKAKTAPPFLYIIQFERLLDMGNVRELCKREIDRQLWKDHFLPVVFVA